MIVPPPPQTILPKSPWLRTIFDSLISGERLTPEHAIQLLLLKNEEDLQALWSFADIIRKQRVGDVVYYSSTLYLYPTNFCAFNCTFCSFYAKPGDPKGWYYSPEQLLEQIHQVKKTITELHIVAGCDPSCNLEYYTKLFTLIKKEYPKLHIKALSAIEYAYLEQLHDMPIREILITLKEAGLDSIPGGGAEILVHRVREILAPGRISPEKYLAIHKLAHELGIPTNSTMVCYHRETPEDIITHMKLLRDLQDETHGFKNFVTIKFATLNNSLGKRLKRLGFSHTIPPKSLIAVARLFLDNFLNLKAMWNYFGIEEALKMLSCGANDLSSTHQGEKIFEMASLGYSTKLDIKNMANLIERQGKTPCLTNSQTV
ncbi:CofH family radical SAM protein [Chlamydia sp. 17-3921]|uniref:CofH family radical SAM protein n=1 Tax=Chlamydia sp. 17-3921 TaxID=2675798 RepID=UPI00191B68DA|nr:CofH family radical SAM protein [Chlamydia sp. 17-3921]